MSLIVYEAPASTIEVTDYQTITVPVVDDEVIISQNETLVLIEVDNNNIISVPDEPTFIVTGYDGFESKNYSRRVDFVGEEYIYRGEADVGAAEDEPKWRLRQIYVTQEGDMTELWANGTDAFINRWDLRFTYTYL